jgi:tetratricopeptide (TPR) repeat protein
MRRMYRKRVVLLLACLLSSAHAQDAADDDDVARVHHEAGRVYLERGRFDDAAREFEEAYELSHRAEILYNLSIAYRDGGRLPEAVDALRRYLATAPDAPNRAMLEERLRTLEAEIAARTAAPAGAEDEDGSEDEGGADGLVIAGVTTLAVGGAALAAAIVTGVLAASETGPLDDLCDDDGACAPGFEEPLESARDFATASNVLFVVAGGVLAAGGVLFVLGLASSGEDEVAVRVGPTGIALVGRMP